jgi:hypothetical protein
MKRAIAKKSKSSSRYDGIPRVVIEAIVEDTLSYLSQHVDNAVTVAVLDEVDMCESCEDWSHPDDMITTVDQSDQTMNFCKRCVANGVLDNGAGEP